MTSLREILNQHLLGKRALPDLIECKDASIQIAVMEAELKFYKESYLMLLREIKA